MPCSVIARSSSTISSNGLAKTAEKTKSRAQVGDALGDRHADRAGRVVDDRRVADLGADRLGDRAKVLDGVARGAVGPARVDVDHHAALVDDAPRLRRVLGRRVGDRRALIAVGQGAGDRARDDGRVVEAHGARTLSAERERRPASG
jgi:hypothetical protein